MASPIGSAGCFRPIYKVFSGKRHVASIEKFQHLMRGFLKGSVMRPPKTVKLLAQPSFMYRRMRRLPQRMVNFITRELSENAEITEEALIEGAIMSEQLSPLELGDIVSISLEVRSRFYYDEQANIVCGYHAETVVPFGGSAALLTAKPAPDFDQAMLGIIQKSHIRVRTVTDNKGWDQVEQIVSEWLPQVRRALNGFGPQVIMFNLRLPKFVAPTVRRYLPHLRCKLRRSS